MRKFLCKPKNKKGVAGLEVLLSVIIMLFVIGFLIMLFAMMGGELSSTETLSASEGPITIRNETITTAVAGVDLTTCALAPNGKATILFLTNASGAELIIESTNYTYSNCRLYPATASIYNATSVNASYTYTYSGVGVQVINDTYTELAETTDWFGIIIVITAMVVLILLTVIIISSIRGTGLVGLDGGGKPPRETA